jgi:hypothetical protein
MLDCQDYIDPYLENRKEKIKEIVNLIMNILKNVKKCICDYSVVFQPFQHILYGQKFSCKKDEMFHFKIKTVLFLALGSCCFLIKLFEGYQPFEEKQFKLDNEFFIRSNFCDYFDHAIFYSTKAKQRNLLEITKKIKKIAINMLKTYKTKNYDNMKKLCRI